MLKCQEEDVSWEHLQRLEDAFSLHDKGNKGYLSKSELRSLSSEGSTQGGRIWPP
jgi:Ca2+-binding EF-hand superfamily protein